MPSITSPISCHLPDGFCEQVLVNGWAINGIVALQTGYPFNVLNSTDRANIAYLPGYSNRGEPDINPGRNGYGQHHAAAPARAAARAQLPSRPVHRWEAHILFHLLPPPGHR